MKRLKRTVTANSQSYIQNEKIFSPSDVVELLSQIKELKSYEISLAQPQNGILQFVIGDYAYEILQHK